ncbi:MAG TPA: SpoIIE family protein phosphatase [Blastocatellia bacterium]|nr:SpoIIE family protein phosphatase [Blastocatellia bacterium]
MTKRLRFILGAIFFALLLIYSGARFYRVYAYLSMKSDPGWSPIQMGSHVRIGDITNAESEGTVHINDEILSINGQPIKYHWQVAEIFNRIEPDRPYLIEIKRNNAPPHTVALRSQPVSLITWKIYGAARLLIPSIFLVTGLVVFLLKPNDKQAFLLALMFGMFVGAIVAINPSFAGEPAWLIGVMLAVQLVSLFLWPVFFHFFLIFPEPSPLLQRAPRLEKFLYAPHLVTAFPYFATLNVLAAFSPDDYIAFRFRYDSLEIVSVIVATLYIAGGLLSLIVNYRQASRSSRRKMRVVVAGSIAGFLPIFLVIGLAVFFNLSKTDPKLTQWLLILAFFSFPLFPLSFAYAIVRHKIIPIRLMVRRSVRYLLVSRGFIIIQALVVFAVLSFLLTGSRMEWIDSLGERADIAATIIATAIAIAALTLVNQRVMPMIDRRFFREAYNAQQILSDLGMEMRRVTSIPQLLKLSAAKIQDALYAENITIFLRDDETGDYKGAISSRMAENGASSFQPADELSIPRDGLVVKRLRGASLPLMTDLDLPKEKGRTWQFFYPHPSDDKQQEEVRKRERALLRRLRAALLLPVATKDELLAIVSLGPRLGDLPFSREDKQLLTAVAWQMAFAIQNARLVQQAAEEERLRRELEIATTVQRRLFPERPPEIESLELAGVCHPARGVGGDYYDFILLDQSRVGIAVADVAGKGISAALLMSTVQASLRSQAQSVNGNLIELVSSMNRLLHVSTDASSYATFFYAQFDEKTGALTYVNAGHNPPMLMRASTAIKAQGAGHAAIATGDARVAEAEARLVDFDLLTTGGPIIGAFNECEYQQETIQMQSGDLLVAYTDGVTEARNASDEEFGEKRLRRILAESSHLSAQELTEKIVESVRSWSSDTPQQDDLTLVVMKVK